MDDRKPSISSIARDQQVDADAAPTDSVRESSSVTYSGSAQRISEGFAIALRAMGVGVDILPAETAPPDTSSNLEDS
jgi:hypothetical protein